MAKMGWELERNGQELGKGKGGREGRMQWENRDLKRWEMGMGEMRWELGEKGWKLEKKGIAIRREGSWELGEWSGNQERRW